jgi:hypothetical protein
VGQAIRLMRSRKVTGAGSGLVSHAGLVWLAGVADHLGLTEGFATATSRLPWRRHQPGRSLAQMMLALADGAGCVSDLAVLGDQQALFGTVPSYPTAWRTFARLGPVELRGIDAAIAGARSRAWPAGAGPADDDVFIVDVDATIVTTKADKQDAAPTYKRTFGHHPLLAMNAQAGEILAMTLRPGNAGSNTAVDHVELLDRVIDALPSEYRQGRPAGPFASKPSEPAERAVLVRTDAAGATHWFAEHCAARACRFSFGYAITGAVRDALLLVDEWDWEPAIDGNGEDRTGAWVVELTDLVDLSAWPPGTRLLVRRERPHPGAQLTLFDTVDGYRHQALITDQTGMPVTLELRHRQRACAEQVIRDAKACGLDNLPSNDVVNNQIWCQLVTAAVNLLAWAKRLTLTGPLRRASPKTIRYRLLHIAAQVRPRRLDLAANWPWTPTLLAALDRLHTLTTPPSVTPRAAT